MLPDEYRLIQNIHSSDISRVFLVENKRGERLVAKLLPLVNPTASKRFERKVEAQKRAAGRHTMPILKHADDYSWYLMPRALRTLSSEPCLARLVSRMPWQCSKLSLPCLLLFMHKPSQINRPVDVSDGSYS